MTEDWIKALFFDGWADIVRTAVVGVLSYVALVVLLRISGKRTLSKMNIFDWVVTVAFGSTLATVLLSSTVSVAEATFAFAVLIGLQYVVTKLSVHTSWVRKLVTGEPTMLLYRGEMLREAMKRERVTEEEILAAVRLAGLSDLEAIEAVVLETDGALSVVKSRDEIRSSSLEGVERIS